jgi:D-alanyl-D-alanine carboxypeptidase
MMKRQRLQWFVFYTFPAGVVLVVLLTLYFFEHRRLLTLTDQVNVLNNKLASTTEVLAYTTLQLSKNVNDLSNTTQGITNTLTDTQQNIAAVKNQVGGVEQSVGSITNTVGTLQKLAQIDPELLKKYSKVYFTNENYVPLHLITVPTEYAYSSKRSEQFLSEASPNLINLLMSAKANGITLYVKSGYRSFAEQKSLKSSYSVTYGAGTANAFSADQGYSEHQLGTTADFITSGLNGSLTGFDTTQSYTWLRANAHRFGFVLSYPKGNSFYVYEPWHWRFVGIKLATYLHDNNKNFYDLDQREIDPYLVDIFD